MTALHKQVVDLWLSLDPEAIFVCTSCITKSPVAGPDGPSLKCPQCAAVPNDERCAGFLECLKKRRDKEQGERQAVEELEEKSPRCDPPGLDDVIGNAAAVAQIRTALQAHRARSDKSPFPHILLAGVGGTGKTMLAEIIAREVKRPIRLQMGQTLNSPARVVEVLLSLKPGDVLFVDECHGLKPQCQESLYRAMEDGIVVPVSKAGNPAAKPIKLPPFTLIGATTDEWGLLNSLLQRFKYRIQMERMSAADLAQAISQRADRKGWQVTAEAAGMIADRAHGTPRVAIDLLDGAMDVALAGGSTEIDAMIVQATADLWRIDGLGLDHTARKYLKHLAEANGALRLNVLASKLEGLSRRTIETRVEPELVYLGLIDKSATGRSLTAAGRQHLKSST